MASPHTGSEAVELIIIDTEDFVVTIKGRPTHPTAEGLGVVQAHDSDSYRATLHIDGVFNSAHVFDPNVKTALGEYKPGLLVYPCFFEQTVYQVVIEKKNNIKLAFYHPHPHFRKAISAVGRAGNVLAGNINFENEIGLCTFSILRDNVSVLAITIEVFPSKLDYRTDYIRLIDEVNKEVYSLAYDIMRRTYLGARLRGRQNVTQNEFSIIIRAIFSGLEVAFARICRSPHQKLITSHEAIRADKARRTDTVARKALLKSQTWTPSSCGIMVNGQKLLPSTVLDARKKVSYDTHENKTLKWMLESTAARLTRTVRTLEAIGSANVDISQELRALNARLKAMRNEQFLSEVGTLTRMDSLSLVLHLAPGYREVYKYFLILQRGLSLHGSLFRISLKDLAQLYEYWCYLALGSIFRSRYDLDRQTVIAIKDRGIVVALDTSTSSELQFRNRDNGETYTLRYNAVKRGLPTTGQRPDTILTLEKQGSCTRYQYVLDAKYRVNPALPDTFYASAYGRPGPEEDDINTMHRYRDALVFRSKSGKYERSVFGAVVLFPYAKEGEYSGVSGEPHHFYASIEEVGIGGLPFLPGHTKLVEQFLGDLILASSDTAFEHTAVHEGTADYFEERFARRNVLVGSVGKKGYVEFHIKAQQYHIPLKQLPRGFSHIEHIALYERDEVNPGSPGIRFYADVLGAEVVSRNIISAFPSASTEPYVLFTTGPWMLLSAPIRPAGYGVRSKIFTTLFLLKQATSLPELSLKSEIELRVWKEIRRLGTSFTVLANRSDLDEANVNGFEVGGLTIRLAGQRLTMGEVTIAADEIRKKPMAVLRMILKQLTPDK